MAYRFRAFNRTSLELKLRYRVRFREATTRLLIAPVWN